MQKLQLIKDPEKKEKVRPKFNPPQANDEG
jgi:hypothetical protein